MSTPDRPRRVTIWTRQTLPSLGLMVGFALIAAAGVGSAISIPTTPQIGTVPAVQAPANASLTAQLQRRPELEPAAVTGATPRRLALPSLRVDVPIVPVGVQPGGGLTVPDDPHVLGWWHGGARPDSGEGSVVIDGHVDTAAEGPGALFSLRELRPGDPVLLSTDHGLWHYLIAALRSYPKADLPAEVFTSTGQPRLVLITCGGAFNHKNRHYADNIIAYAVPAPA